MPSTHGPDPAAPSDATGKRRGLSDALHQALRSLATGRGGESTITPEKLTELAQLAGVTDPAQIAELARVNTGVGSGALGASRVPQHILFMLDTTECALPAEAVQGVERIQDVTPVPNTVSWVLGVVQVWGSILSVVDLRGFVGLPEQPITGRSRLLVVTRRGMTIGFLVDYVTEMRPLGEQAERKQHHGGVPEWARPYATTALALEGRQLCVLDPESLLYSERMQHYRADFS